MTTGTQARAPGNTQSDALVFLGATGAGCQNPPEYRIGQSRIKWHRAGVKVMAPLCRRGLSKAPRST